ncbi:glycosyltransferase [Mycetocola spongiae]|uniref:glycosyltransferase n=1 Tax=Mycetocola spongiae TaxID=2859226 RepID=UPI001CF37963|nr:glycosyltransferase [Mycetocola spongiae]UCR90323.1 glycosyltransferase [Mycetocola spongiae]
MSPRVTAIIVVQDGARDAAHLRVTLAALAAQTRRPDHIIAVAMASPTPVLELLTASVVDQVVALREVLPFGQAVAAGLRASAAGPAEDPTREAYWLLAQDTAPEPEALARLVGALELSPSVAIVGPKLVDWDLGQTIISFGESMTRLGATVSLVENELDQGQHDTVTDVLGVPAAALLIRRGAWEEISGFDPALDRADDGLDLSVRSRLAGHRVSVEGQARVRWAGDGIVGPSRSRKGAVLRRQAGLARSGQLHRRLTYARVSVLWLHWLSLLPIALFRAVWRLISKQPEVIAPEVGAALRVAFSPGRVRRSRRVLAASKHVGWGALSELRIPQSEVIRRSRLRREAGAAPVVVHREDLNFIGGGGGWLVSGALVVSLILFFGMIDARAVAGGALLPLSDSVAQLWGNTGFGWRELGLGFLGAADPFASVLAVLGTLTFWNPSSALVFLYILALPLAALGGWFAATRLTERSGYRLFAGALWALSPSLLISLAAGEPAAIIVHLLLPWLFYTVAVLGRSWGATAVASILLAGILASAPSLIGAVAVLWIVLLVTNWRHLARVIWLLIPTLTLFAPLIWQQGVRAGNWWGLLADPGAAIAGAASTQGWRIALGLPSYTGTVWPELTSSLGIGGVAADWLLPVLLAPLALLAFSALFLRGSLRSATLLGVAALGLVSAVAAGQILVTLSGPTALPIWAGPALSLYWLGLVGSSVVGLDAMRRVGLIPAIVVGATVALVAAPLIVAFPAGKTPIHASDGRTLPAYVTATAATDPRQGTLVIRPEGSDAISATIVRGSGTTLDSRSTQVSTRLTETPEDLRIAELSGNLISASGLDIQGHLADLGVRFVLLAPAASGLDAADAAGAENTLARAASALDSEGALGRVGPTDQGTLWRFDGEIPAPAPVPTSWATPVVGILTGVIFLVALLMSLPTAASRRVAESSPRTIGRLAQPAATGRRARRSGREPGQGRRARLRAERMAEAQAVAAVEAEIEAKTLAPEEPELAEAMLEDAAIVDAAEEALVAEDAHTAEREEDARILTREDTPAAPESAEPAPETPEPAAENPTPTTGNDAADPATGKDRI